MNRSILAFWCIVSVFIVCTILLSCSEKKPYTGNGAAINAIGPASLHVPFRPQIADNLCWAACTEMISMYYHDSLSHGKAPVISQCMEAARIIDTNVHYDCDTITAKNFPAYLNQGSVPFSYYNADTNYCFGYLASSYFGHGTATPYTMSEDTLFAYISKKIPVAFGWYYQGITIRAIDTTGAHFMVAEGVPHSSYISHLWVSVHDPWPVGRGLHRIMAYSEYANQFPPSIASSKTCVFSQHYSDWYISKYPGQPQ